MKFDLPIISADSHIIEPPDLWQARIEPRFRDLAPRVESFEDSDLWIVNGRNRMAVVGIQQQAGLRFEDRDRISKSGRYAEIDLLDPDRYVRDLEADGVSGAVIYSTNAHQAFGQAQGELMGAIARVYNDWILEYCGAHPALLKPITLIDIDDPASAVAEMERTAKAGSAGFMFPLTLPDNRGHHEPEYAPVWAAAESLGLPVSFHVGSHHRLITTRLHLDLLRHIGSDLHVRASVSRMILNGVMGRHPRLRLGIVEFGCGWAPYQLKRLDEVYRQYHRTLPYRFPAGELPSDHFRRNVFLSFQQDAAGVALHACVGARNLLWGNDYPHAESTFPRSREVLSGILSGLDRSDAALIAGGNAAAMYGFDLKEGAGRIEVGAPRVRERAATVPEAAAPRHSAYTLVREPGDLWTSRFPADLAGSAPRVVRGPDGERWVVDDGQPFHSADAFDTAYEGPPSDASSVLRYLDASRLESAVLFPDKARRVFGRLDGDLFPEAIRAYNDWVLDLCDEAGERVRAVALVDIDEPGDGAREMRRAANRGAAGLLIPLSFRQKVRYSEGSYDWIWQTAVELGLPLCLQPKTKRALATRPGPGSWRPTDHVTDDPTWRVAVSTADDTAARLTIDSLALSGVFQRHPRLRIVVAGFGIAWVANSLQRTNDQYEIRPERIYEGLADYHRSPEHIARAGQPLFEKFGLAIEGEGYRLPDGLKPSELILRHTWFVFSDEALDRKCLGLVDRDRLLWGSGSFAEGEGLPDPGGRAPDVFRGNWEQAWKGAHA